jgi:predicted RNA-binding Zn ribbon-like protein
VTYQSIDYVHPALDLVNSQHGRGPDLLDDRRWLEGYLNHWGYSPTELPNEREWKQLNDLRALMRRIVERADRGGTPARGDVSQLNDVIRAVPVSRVLEHTGARFELQLVPARRGWRWVRAEIAAALGELLAGDDAGRIKVCDNEECRFAFYDGSRNRSRRWCSHTTCGNRNKVQAFRARQRQARGARYSASR